MNSILRKSPQFDFSPGQPQTPWNFISFSASERSNRVEIFPVNILFCLFLEFLVGKCKRSPIKSCHKGGFFIRIAQGDFHPLNINFLKSGRLQ